MARQPTTARARIRGTFASAASGANAPGTDQRRPRRARADPLAHAGLRAFAEAEIGQLADCAVTGRSVRIIGGTRSRGQSFLPVSSVIPNLLEPCSPAHLGPVLHAQQLPSLRSARLSKDSIRMASVSVDEVRSSQPALTVVVADGPMACGADRRFDIHGGPGRLRVGFHGVWDVTMQLRSVWSQRAECRRSLVVRWEEAVVGSQDPPWERAESSAAPQHRRVRGLTFLLTFVVCLAPIFLTDGDPNLPVLWAVLLMLGVGLVLPARTRHIGAGGALGHAHRGRRDLRHHRGCGR